MSLNADFPACAICSKPLTRESTVTGEHGLPVHQKCDALVSRAKGVRAKGADAVRCPYCVEDKKFKLMTARSNGEGFLCPNCGHVARPGNPSYRCNCSKCAARD